VWRIADPPLVWRIADPPLFWRKEVREENEEVMRARELKARKLKGGSPE